eukprot:10756296-Karenia_brevis.AAC.1
MQQHNGQFGQRVYLDPKSSAGQALMHSSEDGWLYSCSSGKEWGTPVSGKRIGRPVVDWQGMEYVDDGHVVAD